MEPENTPDLHEDNRSLSGQSQRSTKKSSRASSSQHKKDPRDRISAEDEKEGRVKSKSKARTWHSDPDRDQISDREGRRSDDSFYSEDYEQETPSERSLSPFSRSLSQSPTPQKGVRAKRIPKSPLHKLAGVGRLGVSRLQRPGGLSLIQQHRRGVRSQSKESTPPKDLDLVTKRMLSARLLKINELRNALAEVQQRTDELHKENRILRQLQVRQEKALQRYDDTESEISQLLSRHSNEIHVLRERLRRTQERERAAERRLKDREEQLQRNQVIISRLKKLVDHRELGARDELNRRLEEEKTRAHEAEHKIKDLERSLELSNSSYQRQLAAEKKKTISAQEEIRTLQEDLERLTNKLKEKERELDARNIYANRMVKSSLRKDAESGTKRKVPSRSSTKAVQTEYRASSLDFPTPPPAISDTSEYSEQVPDEYFSLKELDRVDRQAEPEDVPQNLEEQKKAEKGEKEMVKEKKQQQEQKHQMDHEANMFEKENRLRSLRKEKDEEEDRKKTDALFSQREEENYWKRGHVQEEVARWNQESLSNQQAAEEAHHKKEQLLAKMREIDRQNLEALEPSPSESNKTASDHFSPHPPEQRNHNSSIFNLTESEETGALRAGIREGGRRRSGIESVALTAGMGRRVLRSQTSTEDLAFGDYAPSFGHPTSRALSGFPSPPPKEDRDSALEAIGVFNLRGVETKKDKNTEKSLGKGKKSSLMQQLFGAQALDSLSHSNKVELFDSPPAANGVRSRREGLLSFNSGSSTPPMPSVNTLHVADSRPAIRAITSYDDDIEELTL
ncbi:lebercilin [Melanotaenia boesemani]|uniref:lebercilin n=1 Tax=Melanotaenia boesemani TaxID=1250792 RepID=UPI001C046C24|nr:lebercilin [Melanotaenia boesemani]XP_041832742.1 lebercilin [Melanotaenia boesemani]